MILINHKSEKINYVLVENGSFEFKDSKYRFLQRIMCVTLNNTHHQPHRCLLVVFVGTG